MVGAVVLQDAGLGLDHPSQPTWSWNTKPASRLISAKASSSR